MSSPKRVSASFTGFGVLISTPAILSRLIGSALPPEKYRRALEYFKTAGVFGAVSGVLVGKPMDRKYEAEYKAALTDVIADETLPIVCNVNIGHALPRCILPFGVKAAVDVNGQKITFG